MAGFQDDLDSDDEALAAAVPPANDVMDNNYDVSSEDEHKPIPVITPASTTVVERVTSQANATGFGSPDVTVPSDDEEEGVSPAVHVMADEDIKCDEEKKVEKKEEITKVR